MNHISEFFRAPGASLVTNHSAQLVRRLAPTARKSHAESDLHSTNVDCPEIDVENSLDPSYRTT